MPSSFLHSIYGHGYVVSIIVHFKIQRWYESPKNKQKKKSQIKESKKIKVKTSDGENGRVHFYIGLL